MAADETPQRGDDATPSRSDDDEERQPDPSKPTHIFISGRKGEGKTELAWLFFASYPYDRVLIDPNHDIKTEALDNVALIEPPIPSRWPAHLAEDRKLPLTLVFHPDFEDPDYIDDMDRMVRLALNHGRTCIFCDEAQVLIKANQVPPACRRCLQMGRHDDTSQIWATPRAMTIDPLAISQADWTYTFKQKSPADRKRIAENIGYEPKDFDAAVRALGPHEYLRYDDARDDLAHYPALPPELLTYHKG
jgi:hypothetical protein